MIPTDTSNETISKKRKQKIRKNIREAQTKPILPADPIPQDPSVVITWGPAAPSAPPNHTIRMRVASWLSICAIQMTETDLYPVVYPGHMLSLMVVGQPSMTVPFNLVWKIFGALNLIQQDANIPAGHLATLVVHGVTSPHTFQLIK